MLAERFQTAFEALQAQAAQRQQERVVRDTYIAAQFLALDTAFSTLVSDVTGSHPRLAVVKTPVTETFNGRGFTTLTKTVIEVRSTLYGTVESVRFTPGLESIATDQFGAIKVALDSLTPTFPPNGSGPLFASIVDRGILMRGRDAPAGLAIVRDAAFEPLTAVLLEAFLTVLFIRT